MIAVSVDPPAVSAKLAAHLGLTFPLASDPDGAVIRQLGVWDADNEIAWPAMFTIERDRSISWRWLADVYKVRPPAADVIAAIDALHRATGR